jgi:pimeloyl-ACP methyl ester carboxylesterase
MRAFLAVLTVVLAGLTPLPAAGARPVGLQWRPCAEDRTAQCATLAVPVDWAGAYGASVNVAVARRTATDSGHRIGTLVVNPGGPGGSGVDFALGAPDFFSPALRARFDIVGFDPRGVRRSNPVVCGRDVVSARPSPLITSTAAYGATVAYNRRLAADCRKRTGPLFDHVDTASVVRDVDALRLALGEPTISFYGASYGSLIGAQYAERYPSHVRALVLDSVLDHSAGTAGFLATETATAQDSFDEFVTWCARDVACAVHGRDVRALWAQLLDRAARGALRDPFDPSARVTVFDLVGVAFASFYDPQWHALAYYIEAALAPPGRTGPAPAPAGDVVENPFPAVFCADWALPVGGYAGLAATLGRLRSAAPQMLASPLALSAVAGCLGWPSPPGNPQHVPAPARTGPVLLVNSRHDPATAYAWARAVAGQLGPNATLLTYEGWGHVVYGRSACVTGAVDRYLLDGVTPAPGSGCPAVPPEPFGIGRSATAGGELHWGAPVVQSRPYR